MLLGRSSHSSDFRLSANRLISRVHVRAQYLAATPAIELTCLGWNGVKVHCQGTVYDLPKDCVFQSSDTEGAEIMVDVHDSRVVFRWPAAAGRAPLPPPPPFVAIYEDADAPPAMAVKAELDDDDDATQLELPPPAPPRARSPTAAEAMTEMAHPTSAPAADDSDSDGVLSEPDYDYASPPAPAARATPPRKATTALTNHLTNQLAFSRVNALPLSELYSNLPAELAAAATVARVMHILAASPCIGEIKRVGKDAAGKPLESQYYYILDQDRDEGRKAAVGGRSGMRNCRKTHKVTPALQPPPPAPNPRRD